MPVSRVLAHYRGVLTQAAYFAVSRDPVYYRSALQSRLGTPLELMAIYPAVEAGRLRKAFAAARRPDGGYSHSPVLVQYLTSLRPVRLPLESLRKRARSRRRGHRLAVQASRLRDLPDMVVAPVVAERLGMSLRTLRRWAKAGLPLQVRGARRLVRKDDLRVWLLANGRM